MTDPSSIAQEIQAAALQFRASHRTLRSYLPWASNDTLFRLAMELPADVEASHDPPKPSPPSVDPTPASPSLPDTSTPSESDSPPSFAPLDFHDMRQAIRWAFEKRATVIGEESVPSTSQNLYDFLRGATIFGAPINPVSFGRCVASSKDLLRVGDVKDPHHSVRRLAVYELKDKARAPSSENASPPVVVKQPSASLSATLLPAPTATTATDHKAEEVRSRLGQALAPTGTNFLSIGDLFREALKVKDPIHLQGIADLMAERGWRLRGRRPDPQALRKHAHDLIDHKRLFKVGEDSTARGRPRILYSATSLDKDTEEGVVTEASPVSAPVLTQEGPSNAPAGPSITTALARTVHAILTEMGPMATTEIVSTLRRMSNVTTPVQQADRQQVVAVLLRGRGTTFVNKGTENGHTMWGAMTMSQPQDIASSNVPPLPNAPE